MPFLPSGYTKKKCWTTLDRGNRSGPLSVIIPKLFYLVIVIADASVYSRFNAWTFTGYIHLTIFCCLLVVFSHAYWWRDSPFVILASAAFATKRFNILCWSTVNLDVLLPRLKGWFHIKLHDHIFDIRIFGSRSRRRWIMVRARMS